MSSVRQAAIARVLGYRFFLTRLNNIVLTNGGVVTRFKDYGTNDEDDIMVRELRNIDENHLASTESAVKQARERFSPGSPFLIQAEQEYEAARFTVQTKEAAIREYRKLHRAKPQRSD